MFSSVSKMSPKTESKYIKIVSTKVSAGKPITDRAVQAAADIYNHISHSMLLKAVLRDPVNKEKIDRFLLGYKYNMDQVTFTLGGSAKKPVYVVNKGLKYLKDQNKGVVYRQTENQGQHRTVQFYL